MRNILTFDVEDWHQSTVDPHHPITERVASNTARILDILLSLDVRGTFFVLGLVAEAFPDLPKRIAEAGHEVATHGYSHRPVHAMTPEQFRDDLRRSRSLIEDLSGCRVLGYRAPDFSITIESMWALEVIAEEGLRYDSSIFPCRAPRYGIPSASTFPCRVRTAAGSDLLEFPLCTKKYLGLRIPAAGGGYFRLLPYLHSKLAVSNLNRHGYPATAYFHPYELDPEEIRSSHHPLSYRLRWIQGLGRGTVEKRLRRLLKDFAWGSIRDWLDRPGAALSSALIDVTNSAPRTPRPS